MTHRDEVLTPSPVRADLAALRRETEFYRLTSDASEGQWDLLRVSQEFDSSSSDLTETIIENLNAWAKEEPAFDGLRLQGKKLTSLPGQLLLLDGSPNHLPLIAETARIASALFSDRGWDIPSHIVNRREELVARVTRNPRENLVISQACQRSLYDVCLAESLTSRGVTVVPGPITAPGGPLSNKKNTYELLTGGKPRRLTAKYKPIEMEGADPEQIAEQILNEALSLARPWNTSTFFVKPQEGGGGRGCFRLDTLPEGIALPDLSRLSTEFNHSVPLPLKMDPDDPQHVHALSWLARRASRSRATAEAYLHIPLGSETNASNLNGRVSKLLRKGIVNLSQRLHTIAEPPEMARKRLARAIDFYQQFYGVPYQPLICEWMDFGLFGVRAHMRLDRTGPVLESLYARLFPVAFREEGIGLVGVDSITNQKGGGMELNRYTPLAPPLVQSVGGTRVLAQRIQSAYFAFARFLSLLPAEERNHLPVRAEFDLSPMSGFIVEGNADPVRAQCANTNWKRFCANAQTWVEDALAYFAWKSEKK